jgi:hypothetical protein
VKSLANGNPRKNRPTLRQLSEAQSQGLLVCEAAPAEASRAASDRPQASLRAVGGEWERRAQAWAPLPAAQEALDPLMALDALQSAVLCEIFHKHAERFILKGGLAMRLSAGARRHTKDIDLDGDSALPLDAMVDAMRRSLAACAKKGLLEDFHFSEPKRTETTLRFKIEGRYPQTGSVAHLTVEISRRRFMPDQAEPLRVAPRFGEETQGVVVYRKETLMGLKAAAFTDANRCAARDLMDLALLVEAGVEPNLSCLSQESADQLRARKALVWPKVDLIDWALFQEHVLPHLDADDREQWTPARLDEARLAVASAVEDALEREISRRERAAAPRADQICPAPVRAPAGVACGAV